MRRLCAVLVLLASISGCGGDDDDVAEVKTPLPMDKVPAAVLKAAQETAPGLTFFSAYIGTYQGKEAIEMRGKTRSGQIKEYEFSPNGKLLGTE